MTDKEKLIAIKKNILARYKRNTECENNGAGGRFYAAKADEDRELLSFIDSMQEEPVSDELEKVVEEIVDPTVLNAYGVKDIANRLRRTMIEPVSDDLEKASTKYAQDKYMPVQTSQAFKAGAQWQKEKDESTTEDLGEYINELSKQLPEVSFAKLSRIAVRVAKWKEEQFEKNRLAHCDAQTEEEAEIEQSFLMGIIECEHRQPTFDDAIKYGMRLQKEQMINDAYEREVRVDAGGYPYIPQMELYDYDKDVPLAKEGEKVKVIVIKED